MTDSALGPGRSRMIADRYRLDRVIGRGAMGTVWEAYDELLHRAVAIKEVNFPEGMPTSELEQLSDRTLREARAVAALSSPHVIALFDVLTPRTSPIIVMELLQARSLALVLRQDGPLSDGQAATIGVAVAGGLLAAHAAGITHRDVKPGNVLIGRDGRIKLTDFGIARSDSESTLTAAGMLLGSPAYIAPEVASGRPADTRADGWGLGALLFAAVQGRPPYDKGDPIATLTAVVMDPVPPHPNSGRLRGIIDALLVKDPRGRMTVARAHQVLQSLADDPSGMRLTAIGASRPFAGPPSGPMPGQVPDPRPGMPQHHPGQPTVTVVAPPQRPGPPAQAPGPAPTPYLPHPGRPGSGASLPPPPWAGTGSASLPPLPSSAPSGRRPGTTVVAVLVALAAAAAGYFGVRAVADAAGASAAPGLVVPALVASTAPTAPWTPG